MSVPVTVGSTDPVDAVLGSTELTLRLLDRLTEGRLAQDVPEGDPRREGVQLLAEGLARAELAARAALGDPPSQPEPSPPSPVPPPAAPVVVAPRPPTPPVRPVPRPPVDPEETGPRLNRAERRRRAREERGRRR
ncbi:hypothetical protein ACTD5D_41365 [Nocardia takedensis]|uniref:hypothetical protein n=1 Tax=Nocardia takedensis TaxID=259390 RepID=UPI003F75AE44